jgi:carboxyl-terminal processing protease
MHFTHSIRKTSTLWAALFLLPSLALFPSLVQAGPHEEAFVGPFDPAKIKQLLVDADLAERELKWEKACGIYETLLRSDRNLPEVRGKYLNSMRRIWQARRQGDAGFRKDVLTLDYGQSVKLYNTIIETLIDNSLEGKDKRLAALLHKGVEELSVALADPNFVQQHLPSFTRGDVAEFRELLQTKWGSANPTSRAQLSKHVREIALAAQGKLQLNPAVTIMELASGSCYAFDDYTAYLTPNQLNDLYESLKGDYVGIGMSLMAQDGKIVIADVAPFTPAGEINPPLQQGDHLVAINKKVIGHLTPEVVMGHFEGPIGSTIELDIISPTTGMRSITLRRRVLASVSSRMQTETVGYIHIACFQETTLQEVDEAIMNLNNSNMKALVLDLRGNSGGLFDVAVEVARRFLSQGVVVSTQNSQGTTILHSRNPGALGVPLVVLVDSDTASSAEVLAGALKDNKRGRLIGEATFGKGCTQSIFRLPASSNGAATGGLRITIARFFSPDGSSFSGRGVVPHVQIDRALDLNMMMDHLIDEAIHEAQRLIGS